jgi:hypothetical protein
MTLETRQVASAVAAAEVARWLGQVAGVGCAALMISASAVVRREMTHRAFERDLSGKDFGFKHSDFWCAQRSVNALIP